MMAMTSRQVRRYDKRLDDCLQADEDDGKGLVDMVMDLLGIDPNSIGEDDNLAGMGIDSMQVVEVRARIQRALGRPIPLEEVHFARYRLLCARRD